MEESKKKILKRLSNDLSQINIDNFLSQIQNATLLTECIDISLKFCEIINNAKNSAYLGLNEELELLKKNIDDFEASNNIVNNELLVLFSNLKNIIAQNKTKIKSINSNINDIFTNLNLINSNIEKKKYSLASSRIEKLYQLKNTILINIKQLDNNQQKSLEELKYEQFTKTKLSQSSSTIKVRAAPTPFPTTSCFNYNTINNPKDKDKDSSIIVKRRVTLNNNNSKNLFTSAKKKIINRRNRDFSLSGKDSNRTSTSINRTLKEYSTMTNFNKKNVSLARLDDNKKEMDDLKKKLLSQKGINDKLRREMEKLKMNIYKNNINNGDDLFNNNLKKLSISMSQNISFFNEKINKTSDLLFSLTFSFNSLQNKCNKLSSYNENEQDFSDIKNKLLNITTEISELKSSLLKITFETDEYKKTFENSQNSQIDFYTNNSSTINNTNQSINFSNNPINSGNIIYSQLLESSNNITDSSSINNIQIKNNNNSIDNQNVESLISTYKSEILNLTNKLNTEQKLKENLKNKNQELSEKLQKMQKMSENQKNQNFLNSDSLSMSMSISKKNNNDILNTSLSMKSNSEINGLREKLRISENKIMELQSYIDSKNLIENLLKKNLEEIKLSNEQKIIKFKKKL